MKLELSIPSGNCVVVGCLCYYIEALPTGIPVYIFIVVMFCGFDDLSGDR
jgi:hypothetical protein